MPNKNSGPDYLDYTGQEELNERLRKRRARAKGRKERDKKLEDSAKKAFKELKQKDS